MLVIVTGPTGSGKTSVVLQLEQMYRWCVIKTQTTRPPRHGARDTKLAVGPSLRDSIARSRSDFRVYDYEGHIYATPMRLVTSAARTLTPVSVIDWVHPHPEDLSYLGPHVLAVVLLPSLDEIRRRLQWAGRAERFVLASKERRHIDAMRSSYTHPWTLIESDTDVKDLARTIADVVLHSTSPAANKRGC